MIELAERQGLAIQALADDADLSAALAGGLPAAIAWDVTHGDANHLMLAQNLRTHPQLGQVPFILYGAAGSGAADLGITSFVAKPVPGQTLQNLIQAMGVDQVTGALLIVDDNVQALELYRGIAAKALPHCRVQIAHDGAAAIAIMAEATPAAVVLDLVMPELDGFQVLDWMRSNPRTRRVPVLVLSGRVLSFDDLKRIEQHALVTLQSKDILSEQELAQSVQQVLGGTLALGQSTSNLVKRALVYMHQHYEHPFTRNEIAQSVGVTNSYLSRIFRQELGLSPWEYLTRYRIRQARQLLRITNDNITDIALQVGFDDKAYFTRVFHRYTGCSPSIYRKRRE